MNRYVEELKRKIEELTSLVDSSTSSAPLAVGSVGAGAHCLPSHNGPAATQCQPRPIVQSLLETTCGLSGLKSTGDDGNSISYNPGELTEINHHTQNVEFYGGSSSFALLYRIQRNGYASSGYREENIESSLVSSLHNPRFSPNTSGNSTLDGTATIRTGFYFPHAQDFLTSYFDTLHYIHPMLIKSQFLERCKDLWFGDSSRQSKSFLALYYSLLSLGALVRVWGNELKEGLNRLQWSRKMFESARTLLAELGMTTNMEIIHCLFFMVGQSLIVYSAC